MRAKLTPTFTSGKMKMTFTTVLEICEEMINYISEHESVVELEMKDIIARFMTDVIANVAFGLEVNSMRNPHAMFREMGRRVFNPPKWQLMKLSFVMVFSKLARKFNIRVLERAVADFFMSTFTETMNYREKNNVKRNDFFNLLLELKNHEEEHERLTVNELAAQAFVFFLAGFETSSTVMTFALYELALNPDIQERLREEIKMILARHENQITYGAMMEMTYMEMVIDEVLRMYPPATLLLRVARDDYQIPGTELTIEKDTLVIIPIYAIQRDADIYENPEKFDPERFSEENKAKRHAMAFLAFGELFT